jgi:hypothetical protein
MRLISITSKIPLWFFIFFYTFFFYGCANTVDSDLNNDLQRIIVKANLNESDILPCNDYFSGFNYLGFPYYVQVPGRVVLKHEGIDFCTNSNERVISPVDGIIDSITKDDPNDGGYIIIRTNIKYLHEKNSTSTSTLYVYIIHLTPDNELRRGIHVRAGDYIGYVAPAGKPHIGPRTHLHLQVGNHPYLWKIHTDPNRFWQKGAGRISCFNSDKPPTDQQLVVPYKCPTNEN